MRERFGTSVVHLDAGDFSIPTYHDDGVVQLPLVLARNIGSIHLGHVLKRIQHCVDDLLIAGIGNCSSCKIVIVDELSLDSGDEYLRVR